MVKIRYSELPAGLHVVAEACRRGAVVYLLPGLTPAQRRAALVRVRSSARMGHGPPMPRLSMALAVAADRARTTTRNGAAALRRHPMVLLPPLIAVLASAIVFTLMSFVTLTIAPPDNAAAAAVPTLGIDAGQTAGPGAHDAGSSGGLHKPALSPSPRPSLRSRRHRAAASPSASASGIAGSPSHLAAPSPSTAHGSPSTAHGSPSPSPSSPHGGRCIKVGPLRFCVRS
jgi:hypothetical protein